MNHLWKAHKNNNQRNVNCSTNKTAVNIWYLNSVSEAILFDGHCLKLDKLFTYFHPNKLCCCTVEVALLRKQFLKNLKPEKA